MTETAILRLLLGVAICVTTAMLAIDITAGLSVSPNEVALLPARLGGPQNSNLDDPLSANRLRPYLRPAIPATTIRPLLVPDTAPQGSGDRTSSLPDTNLRRAGLATEATAMEFWVGTDGTVFAEGTIVPGTTDRFREFLAAIGPGRPKILQLHSPGGSVRDAIAIARIVRATGLDTIVTANGYCASSCPLIFAGGTRRAAHRDAWIGVHQVYARASETGTLQQGMDEAQRISAEAQSLLLDLGVDPRLWVRAMQTPRNKIYLLTVEELTGYRLATAIEG